MSLITRRTEDPDAGEPTEQPAPDPSAAPGREDASDHPVPSTPHDGVTRQLHAELAGLRELFERRLRYDETREAQFSRLYDELDSYKRAESSERMLGLARGILLVIDQIESGRATDVVEIAEDLLDCLATEGIEPIVDAVAEPGSGVEQVVGFTDDGTRRLVRPGYRHGGTVLRARQVLSPGTAVGGPR